jgi:hypothetical protein
LAERAGVAGEPAGRIGAAMSQQPQLRINDLPGTVASVKESADAAHRCGLPLRTTVSWGALQAWSL